MLWTTHSQTVGGTQLEMMENVEAILMAMATAVVPARPISSSASRNGRGK